eukprot:1131710-Prymnesium_polylepis.1
MRAAKLVAANALPAGSTARCDAVAAVSANDARIPVYALNPCVLVVVVWLCGCVVVWLCGCGCDLG